jgi:hypothetical protein
VNDAFIMQRRESGRDLPCDRQRALGADRAAANLTRQ